MSHDARRYWTESMEAAHGFMQQVLAVPIDECGEPMDCLEDAAADAGVEIAFPGGKHLGLHERLFHVRRSLIEPLLRVASALGRDGLLLHVEDAYRLPAAQAQGAGSDFVIRTVLEKVAWETGDVAPDAELVFRRLCVWSATTPIFANHTSGSAIDVSLLRRDDRSNVDLGAPYPQLSHLTPMASPFVSAEVRANRDRLCEVFAAEGFAAYPYEFWHFSRGDADWALITGSDAPARFGPVTLCEETGRLTPVEDPHRPFITVDDVRRKMADLAD